MATQSLTVGKRVSLETLPTELKVTILCYLPDEASLNNLTRVSTVYRTVQENFDEVLTNVAMNHLTERGFDLFGQQNVMQVCLLESMDADADFLDAVQRFSDACQAQNANMRSKPVALSAAVCRQVLRIVSVVGWTVADTVEQLPTDPTQPINIFSHDSSHAEKLYGQYYRTGYLAGQPSDDVNIFNSSLIFLGESSLRSADFKEKTMDIIRVMSFDKELRPSLFSSVYGI